MNLNKSKDISNYVDNVFETQVNNNKKATSINSFINNVKDE